MKAPSLAVSHPLKNTQFWLLVILGGLVAIHLSLDWRLTTDVSRASISLLCWGAVLSLLSEKRHKLRLESDVFSTLLGLLLIAFVLLRNWFIIKYDAFFDLSPFIASLGLAILASGVTKLRQYFLELAVIFALTAPLGVLTSRIDITTITAQFSTWILYYLGFAVSRQGININLPTGSVEVVHGCSGLDSMVQMLRLSMLFLVMFPTGIVQKLVVPVAAVLIAFLVNVVRIALMAILIAYSSRENFEYWHNGSGSQIYFLISTLIFGCFCYFIISRNDSEPTSKELSEL